MLINLVTNSFKFTKTGLTLIKLGYIKSREKLSERFFDPVPYDDEEFSFEKNLNISKINDCTIYCT